MNEHPRDDELAGRITRALRSREATPADVADLTARLEARLAAAPGGPRSASLGPAELPAGSSASVTPLARRGTKAVAAGVVLSALAVYGAGAAAAANPYSSGARAVESVAQAVGIDWSAMPDGYTREQYEAFWGAGFTTADVDELSALWTTDATETKARAGQLILDGEVVPVTPGTSSPATELQSPNDALWAAGYTIDDLEQLAELWSSDLSETKARAGQLLLDGATLPLAPSDAAGSTGSGAGS
ncbi:hypothetical protein [Pengzhenrongella sicca]|uniref:Uncharacterized protein n=1 Tax=Pengzhenrongella sicca TaxID=2819238 RepID=A0A8A4ZH23_9MICO|nr:hypothetical protein [Pengzhenrongella sicca]QTE31174.1 hypothetical protein J4E96_09765 [Pengzhenrongella sicca]